MVHCLLANIGDHFLRNVAFTEEALQKQIACVGVVPQYLCNCLRMPFLTIPSGLNPLLVQSCCNAVSPHAVEKFPVNAAHKLGLLRNDTVFALLHSVAKHPAVPRNTRFKVSFNTPFLVLTDRAAFFLGIGSQNGEHQFTVRTHGADILLFEEHIDAQVLQLPDGFQKRDGVAGKA